MIGTGFADREISGGVVKVRTGPWLSDPLRQRYFAIAIVGAVHVAVLWALAIGIRPDASMRVGGSQELQIRLLSPNLGPTVAPAPPLDWDFETPETVLVSEPQIAIAPDQEAGEGIVGSAITQKLAPRLDPQHVNQRPELPRTMGGIIAALSLRLRILVLPNGTVGNAQIVRSTGEGEIDRLAIETIKNSWRYLPASINGKPIEAWTTVLVSFAPF